MKGRKVNAVTIQEFFIYEDEVLGYSPRSINYHKVALKAGVKLGMPSHDIRVLSQMDYLFKSIKTSKPETGVKADELFTKQEIRAIQEACPPNMKHITLFIQACYDTGSRVSECLSMKLENCVEDSEAVRCLITGKGKKQRTLFMTKALFHRIRKHFKGTAWLFEHHGKRYSRSWMWDTISRFGRQATGRRIHPHSLRHSRITHMLEDGLPLDAVSRFAGHVNVETTLKFYAHVTLKAKQITRGAL